MRSRLDIEPYDPDQDAEEPEAAPGLEPITAEEIEEVLADAQTAALCGAEEATLRLVLSALRRAQHTIRINRAQYEQQREIFRERFEGLSEERDQLLSQVRAAWPQLFFNLGHWHVLTLHANLVSTPRDRKSGLAKVDHSRQFAVLQHDDQPFYMLVVPIEELERQLASNSDGDRFGVGAHFQECSVAHYRAMVPLHMAEQEPDLGGN